MAEQRQPFRFRLPWLISTAAPRPAAEPPRPTVPKVEAQVPARSADSIPVQRPPFRPPGIAPAQPPPPQPQAQSRTESQPPSPSRTTTESRLTSQPSSPSPATTESRLTSQPASPTRATTLTQAASLSPSPSPSRAGTEPQVTSQPASPSPATTQTRVASLPSSPSRAIAESRVISQPASPSRMTSQSRPASQAPSPSRGSTQSRAASVPPSPSRLAAQPAGRLPTQPASPSRTASQVAKSVSQITSPLKKSQPTTPETSLSPPSPIKPQEPMPVVSQPLLQEPQKPKMETTPQVSKADLEDPATNQKSDSISIGADPASDKAKETANGKKAGEELSKQEHKNGSASENPLERRVTKFLSTASGSGTNAAFQSGHRPREKQPILERKETLMTTGSNGKQIKTGSSQHPKEKNHPNESHKKAIISNGDQAPLHKEIREDISKLVYKLATQHPKDEKPVSIITLAGENMGASMQSRSQSTRKDESIHIHRGYRTNPDDSTEATTDGEEIIGGRKFRDPKNKDDPTTKAHINSNAQSVNNSIVFDSSVKQRNPGVQLALSHTLAKPSKINGKSQPLETHKAEANISQAQKLTYEPTVRRRCLRGLFMEPVDSDPDDPNKPRRHGCRYNCGEKNKDKEIGIL